MAIHHHDDHHHHITGHHPVGHHHARFTPWWVIAELDRSRLDELPHMQAIPPEPLKKDIVECGCAPPLSIHRPYGLRPIGRPTPRVEQVPDVLPFPPRPVSQPVVTNLGSLIDLVM